MRKTYASLLVAASVGLGACAGSAPTVAPPVTTTLAPVVTTTVTTVPATTTTTGAPTTTVVVETTTTAPPVVVSEEAAIRQAVLDYEEARYACLSAPPSCDPTTVARGAQLQALREFLDTAIALDARSRRRDDDPSYWVLDTVTIAEDGLSADVTGCFWSTNIVEGTAGVPINDDVASYTRPVHLVKEGERWWVEGIEAGERFPDQNVCGPRP